jgi:hypothetical protein
MGARNRRGKEYKRKKDDVQGAECDDSADSTGGFH